MAFQKVVEKRDPVFEFKNKDDFILGYLIEVKGELGIAKSTLYILSGDKEGNNRMGVWGTTVLNKKMHDVKIGDLVKIVYLGKEKGKGIQTYHNFEVLVDDGQPEQPLEALAPQQQAEAITA
jgi:hypothetical protein